MSAAAITRPALETGSPEWRAAILGQAIAYAGHLTGPICPFALHRYLQGFLGAREEECGGDIFDAVVMLAQSGLFTISTTDPVTGAISFGGDTTLTPTPALTAFVYGSMFVDEGEDDEGEEL